MKKLSILLGMILIAAAGCHKAKNNPDQAGQTITITDTIYNADSSWVKHEPGITVDSFLVIVDHHIDSLKDIIRSRDSALFEARFKLARVWYYDSLCLKNSRLDKYLKGWIRRALEK